MLFLLRKLFQAAMLLAGVALISFILFQYLGDPVANMLPESATEVERMQLRASLGLNDPVFIQFLHYISRLLHGNFGISYYNQVSVFQLIMERLPATLELVFVAVVISLAVGFPLGVWVAITRNKILRECADPLVDWRLTAVVSYRHHADYRLFGMAGMVPLQRPRRNRQDWFLVERFSYRIRLAFHRTSGAFAGSVDDNHHYAPGAHGNAGSDEG